MRTFAEVADLLRRSSEALCRQLLPGGRKVNGEWVAGDFGGGKGRSLSINLREGVWKDFAGGEGGADLINLVAAVNSLSPIEALRWSENWLGLAPIESGERRAKASASKVLFRETSTPVAVAVADAANREEDEDQLWYRSCMPTHIWDYVNADGEVVGQVYRFKHPTTGRKAVRPWDPKKRDWKAPKVEEGGEKRPLLYLQEIMASPAGAPVVVCEGEKAADAVREAGWVATTCLGGANAVGMTDWTPLSGRNVILWRDHDKAGRQHAERLKEELRGVQVGAVREVAIPADKPPKWDAADAPVEERFALLTVAAKSRPLVRGEIRIAMRDWDVSRLVGDPPPVRQLVMGGFPIGSVSLVAGMGDIGKGMMLLDLALKVAGPPDFGPNCAAFGGRVQTFGRVVILAAEDDTAAIHNRVHRLTEGQNRADWYGRLSIVSLPNAGGNYPLIRNGRNGVEFTARFDELQDQLAQIEDLALVILDPLSRFAQANLERDVDASQMMLGGLGSLAAEMNCSVIVAHHMAKSRGKETRVVDAVGAREMIRGSTGLVDGVRAAYALWPETDMPAAKHRLDEIAIPIQGDDWRGRVVYGAMVKSNGPHDRTVRTFVRNEIGLLEDRTGDLSNLREVKQEIREKAKERAEKKQAPRNDQEKLLRLVAEQVRLAAEAGFPYTRSDTGCLLYKHRAEIAQELRKLGKSGLFNAVDEAIDAGLIVFCSEGGKTTTTLDVPNGPFAMATGSRAAGKRTVPKAKLEDIAVEPEPEPAQNAPWPDGPRPFVMGIDND